MNTNACSNEGCNENVLCKNVCKSCYHKAYYAKNIRKPKAIKVIHQCLFDDCGNDARVKGFCLTHYYKTSRNIRVSMVKVFSPSDMEVSTADVTYMGAHKRLENYRGLAALYECPCGKPAEQWAHNHSDNENTRQELKKNYQGNLVLMDYSLSIWDYMALCRSCHTKLDRFNQPLLHDYEVAA